MRTVWVALAFCVGLLAPQMPAVSKGQVSAGRTCWNVTIVRMVNGLPTSSVERRCTGSDSAAQTAEPVDADPVVQENHCEESIVDRLAGRNVLLRSECELGDSRGGPSVQEVSVNWPAIVMRAFRATPIPTARTIIQPPGGKTLVNFDTLFRTEAQGFTRTMRLLGSRIQLRITPSSYTWVTGDGEQFVTTKPGVAFEESLPMSAYNSHLYVKKAEALHPRVDITWEATYRVGAGPWLPVAGSVTKAGPESTLQVVEGRPTLIDDP